MSYFYVSQSDLESYLDVSLTTNGVNQFILFQQAIQDAIDRYCNRSWNVTNPITENFDALSVQGQMFMSNYEFFPKYPPISQAPANNSYPLAGGIISVSVSGNPVDMNYVVNNNGVSVKLSSSFPSVFLSNPLGYKMVQVQYNSDAAQNVPTPIKLAAVQWIARLLQNAPDAGQQRDRVGAGSIQAAFKDDFSTDMPDFVRLVLNQYRLPAVDRF